MDKIKPLEWLAGMGGILLHGSFDCLHVGHLRYFTWGRKLSKEWPLIVTLTADAHFPAYKGPNRPAFPEGVRAEWLSYIGIIDYIAIVYEPTGVLAINMIKPAIYAKGRDWQVQGILPDEEAAVIRHGGTVHYMPKEGENGQTYSSGRILSGQYLAERTARAVIGQRPAS